MGEKVCVVVGGGYAGIHAIKSIQKAFQKAFQGKTGKGLRLILMDRNPHHVRKVLLFKPAAGEEAITVPFAQMFPSGVEFVCAAATRVDAGSRRLYYREGDGEERFIGYDMLVMAAGSEVRQAAPEQGGIALTDADAARCIRETWQANMRQAAETVDARERQRLLTVAVAGAGISGVETAAELAAAMRQEAMQRGLRADEVRVYLVNAQDRLFKEGSAKSGSKIERALTAGGVTVLHNRKAIAEADGVLRLSNGESMPVGLCIWSLGLVPSPLLRQMGLPLQADGYVLVDGSYRVQGAPGVYSIGDCAHVVDPAAGLADRKTCKEAIAQAGRLGEAMLADAEGRTAPTHKRVADMYCVGLGPGKGMAWARQWGLDIMLAGRIGWRMRKQTWDTASFL